MDMIYDERELVVHIDELLEKYDISQAELSRLTGIDHARISGLKTGKRQRIQIDHIVRIAEALNIDDIREIMTIERKD